MRDLAFQWIGAMPIWYSPQQGYQRVSPRQHHTWVLKKETILLGMLTFQDQKMFWTHCTFEAPPEFEQYRPLFTHEYMLLDSEFWEAWGASYNAISQLRLSLHYGDEFDDSNTILLHIVDDTAWFRPLNSPWIGGWISG